ncbi:MAG: excalibur calcium-binding domain-containing protein [Nostocoides sp.]
MSEPAGWYPTKDGLRYWDGTAWTNHLAPAASTAEQPPDMRRRDRPAESRPARSGKATWIAVAVLAVVALLVASGGLANTLILAGLVLIVVAVVALIRGNLRWAHVSSRAQAAVALVGAILLVSLGGAAGGPADQESSATGQSDTTAAPPVTTSPARSTSPSTSTSTTTARSPATTQPEPSQAAPAPSTTRAATSPRPLAPTTAKASTPPTTAKPTAPNHLVAAPSPSTAAPARTDPRFRTCQEVIAAGLGPYEEGKDPEYPWYRDADHDGIVCER